MTSAEYFIKTQARNLIQSCGIQAPPVDPFKIANWLGIAVSEAKLQDVAGMLLPAKHGLLIQVNTVEDVTRKRFSCAHEIMHSFFLDGEGRRFIETVLRRKGFSTARKFEERLCNIGAIELLAPNDMFSKAQQRLGFSIKSLELLANVFSLSIPATAIRMWTVRSKITACSAICWETESNPGNATPRIRVQYATALRFRNSGRQSSNSMFYRPLLQASVSVRQAYETNNVVRSEEKLPVGKLLVPCHVESKGFSNPPYRYVISLALPTDGAGWN